jgi:DNA-binding CsgD family transcriptional regulator
MTRPAESVETLWIRRRTIDRYMRRLQLLSGRPAAARWGQASGRPGSRVTGGRRSAMMTVAPRSGGDARGAVRSGSLGELTARELEVLRLVAQGMSDAEIAERLVVSQHTVHRHVANVRTKLRLPSRAAAVAYAARAGLI